MARSPWLQSKSVLPVTHAGAVRVVAVADTHSAPHPNLMQQLEHLRPDAVLHGGDVGDLSVLEQLSRIAPLFAVRGNIDVRARSLPDELVLDVVSGDQCALRILLLHIGLQGTRLRTDAAQHAAAAGASMVVCGHSHIPFIGKDRGLEIFNPGSAGPRRFGLPIVFGTLEIGPTDVHLGHVDCETGGTWTPRGARG